MEQLQEVNQIKLAKLKKCTKLWNKQFPKDLHHIKLEDNKIMIYSKRYKDGTEILESDIDRTINSILRILK
jgi:hypothetical protein